MTSSINLKQSARLAVLAVSLIVGSTTLVSAHSVDACVTDIIIFCETAHGDAAERHACIVAGTAGCPNHPHSGPVPPAPDPNFSANPKGGVNVNPDLKKLQQ